MGRTINTIVGRTDELARILRAVAESVGLVIEYLDRESGKPQERRGGYLCVVSDFTDAPVIIHAQIGLVSPEKVYKYYRLSREKCRRLAERPGDVSSWQTRDPEARVPGQPVGEAPWGQWGGAIRARGAILSFSGLPEYGDEAAMLLVAVRLGILAPHDGGNIGSVSKNATFVAIMAELEQAGRWNNGQWTVPQE